MKPISLIKIRDVVRSREPEILTKLGKASKRNGTDRLSPRDIQRLIKSARKERLNAKC